MKLSKLMNADPRQKAKLKQDLKTECHCECCHEEGVPCKKSTYLYLRRVSGEKGQAVGGEIHVYHFCGLCVEEMHKVTNAIEEEYILKST
jgi:hypothetical protein